MSAVKAGAQAATKYLRDSYNEMRNVVWPNRRQVIMHTILVIVFSVLIALFLGVLDMIFAFILEKVLIR
ncbi:preprotein translocase subunit SecE [Candidatus Uhrbacteria bacterium]|nr:preprotein translocase subunit SecE [Candidatus Uhrbacteria bacterium]